MTTASIIEKESMAFFSNPGWDLILKYLTLPDLESVSQSHPELRKTVGSYLARGHPLTIHEETVWKYPIDVNRPLYNRYGSRATNIVIDGVHEYDLGRLFDLFPNIHQLTMRNVDIFSADNIQWYPFLIRKLCLINCKITHIDQWMSKMDRLQSLFLQGNNMMLIDTKNLKSLTLINQELIELINYFCDREDRWWVNLRELTIDTWDRLKHISALRHLERLRVFQSVDPRNRECVEALNTSSLGIHYFDIPTEDTPIFRLNEYCFLHLQRFLGEEDCISLRNSHPVFQKLIISSFTIDQEALDRRPLLEHYDFYQRICAEVSELVVIVISFEEVGRLLPLISDGLRKLTLIDVRVPHYEFRNFLRGLNGSLSTLILSNVGMDVTDSLHELQNVQEFSIYKSVLTEGVLSFLRVNQRSMRRLVLNVDKLCVDEAELWRVIAKMENLVKLDMNCSQPEAMIPAVANGLLPKLEDLSLYFQKLPRELLRCLDGAALKKLVIGTLGEDVEEIVRFEGLRKLRIYPGEDEDLVVAVRGLPQLIELELAFVSPPVEKLGQLRSYWKQKRRDLKIKIDVFDLYDFED